MIKHICLKKNYSKIDFKLFPFINGVIHQILYTSPKEKKNTIHFLSKKKKINKYYTLINPLKIITFFNPNLIWKKKLLLTLYTNGKTGSTVAVCPLLPR